MGKFHEKARKIFDFWSHIVGFAGRFLWNNLFAATFYAILLAVVTLLQWSNDSTPAISIHNFSQGLRSAFLPAVGLGYLRGLILLGSHSAASKKVVGFMRLIQRLAAGLLTSVIVVLSFAEVWISIMLHSRWSDRIIRLIADTNKGESGEFINRYLLSSKSIATILGFFLLTFILYRILLRVASWLSAEKRSCFTKWKALAAVVILGAGFWWWSLPPENNFNAENNFNTLLRMQKMWKVYERTKKNIKALELTPRLADGLIKDSTAAPVRIIWVIGESDSKAHWSLYGYRHPTTPRMEKLMDAGNLIKFEDVICFEPRTYRMMEILFSPYVVTDSTKFYLKNPLTPMILRKAGYDVRLHDNQATLVRGDDQAEVGTCNFMNSSALSKANFDYRNERMYRYDLDLIEAESGLMRQRDSEGVGNSESGADSSSGKGAPYHYILDIYHINGQHFSACNRYPAGFGRFTGNDYGYRKDLSEEERCQVAAYDNATLYVDSVLMRIAKEIEGENAVIIYHPDHGEEMNDRRHCHVRTMDSHKNPVSAPYVLEIPFIVITTPEFRKANPELHARLQSAAAEPQSLIYFSHFLLDLAGVESKYKRPDLSPLSKEWRKPPRVVKEIGTYDNWKEKNKNKLK